MCRKRRDFSSATERDRVTGLLNESKWHTIVNTSKLSYITQDYKRNEGVGYLFDFDVRQIVYLAR